MSYQPDVMDAHNLRNIWEAAGCPRFAAICCPCHSQHKCVDRDIVIFKLPSCPNDEWLDIALFTDYLLETYDFQIISSCPSCNVPLICGTDVHF